MGVDYVDIFYSHRFDPETPLEETMGALDTAVRQGKALYAGISSYPPDQTAEAADILGRLGTPLLIHQPPYSMFNRWIEHGLLDTFGELDVGCIVFSPLAQGLLTDRYLDGVPEGSRASQSGTTLDPGYVTEETLDRVRALDQVARAGASPWPRWPWPGRSGTPGSRPRWSGPAASSSWSRTWPPWTPWPSPTTSSRRSTPSFRVPLAPGRTSR